MNLPTMHPVKSSHIEAIGHDGEALFVRFKNGSLYSYHGVPTSAFSTGLEHESPGRWFRETVGGKYLHRKHDA